VCIVRPHTHSTEDASHLCNKVELSLSGPEVILDPLIVWERHRLDPVVHQSQARVVVVGLADVANGKAFLSQGASVCRKWRLGSTLSFWKQALFDPRTTRIRTARSRRFSFQKAQLPNHRSPSAKAIGTTTSLSKYVSAGSVSPSTTRARATCQLKISERLHTNVDGVLQTSTQKGRTQQLAL
jgi:hypothetical protein